MMASSLVSIYLVEEGALGINLAMNLNHWGGGPEICHLERDSYYYISNLPSHTPPKIILLPLL